MKVRIGGDATGFKRALDSAKGEAVKGGKSIAAALSSPLGMAMGGAGAVAGILAFTKAAVDAGDKIDKGSQKLGISAEQYQRLDRMAGDAGATIEQVIPAFSRMAKVLQGADEESKTAQKSLERIGLTVEDLKGKRPDEQFGIIARRLNTITDASTKAATAQAVFGRSALELMPLINGYDDLEAKFRDVAVMTDENVKAAARYKDAMDAVSISLRNIVVNSGFIGFLANAAEGMDELISKTSESKAAQNKAFTRDTGVQYAIDQAKKSGKYNDEQIRAMEKASHSYAIKANFGRGNEANALLLDQAMREAGLGSMARSKTLEQAGMWGASQYDGSKDNASPAATKADIEAAGNKKLLDELNQILIEGEKNLAELRAKKAKEEEDAAKAKAEAEKKALAEAERAAKEKERQQEAAAKQVADMEHELKMQQMLNEGKKREAAIEDEVYRAKQRSSELTDDQIAQIEDMAGQLYDLKEKEDATAATARGGSSRVGGRDDTTTAMERMGAILGGVGGANSQTLRIQNEHVRVSRESLRVLNKISDKTGEAAIGSI